MNKYKSYLWAMLSLLTFALVSCDETESYNAFDNWQARNVEYITNIKDQALANAEGNWLIIKDYNYSRDDSTTMFNGNVAQYVYAQSLIKGEGTSSPLFTDSIYVSYSGEIMPYVDEDGNTDTTVFQKTFYANPEDLFVKQTDTTTIKTLAPTKMAIAGLTSGFASAVLHMHKGDVWKVYIPYQLGYGSTEKTSIPAYSTLIFYIYLQGFGATLPDWR